ncbi:MAG: winged helix-turn-helix transcriptional regulator [Bacteroidales bacterium]|nr:winged helix-turn-helix transcriptional regulator [Candidatus Liminaster caballi]
MYDDRLEIYSPGGLMDGGSIKDMDVMNMASRRRNPVLADVFNRLKYMERRGSGFKKIFSAYKEHEGYKDGLDPTFSTPWDSFVLTLPKFNVDGIEGVYVSNGDDVEEINVQGGQKGGQKGDFTETLQKLYRNLTDTGRKIVELIESDKFVTTTKMAEQIGKSRQTIATRIKDLQEKGIVRRNGPDNGGYWEFLK